MDSLKTKYNLLLISSIMIFGGGIGVLLHYIFPAFYPQWYFGILFFFLIAESFVIFVVDKGSNNLSGRKLVNLYMAIKGIKILLALIFVGIYAAVIKDGIKNFVMVFILFYLIYLGLELPFYAAIERRVKATKHE